MNFSITASDRTVKKTLKSAGLKSNSRQKNMSNISYCFHNFIRIRFFLIETNYFFSNESKFNVHGFDGGKRVWCFKNNLLHKSNIQSIKKFGEGNAIDWGCITSNSVGKIIRVLNKMALAEYCTILDNALIETYIQKI